MTHQLKALQLSLAVHVTIVLLVALTTTGSMVTAKAPIVIDFTLENSVGPPGGKGGGGSSVLRSGAGSGPRRAKVKKTDVEEPVQAQDLKGPEPEVRETELVPAEPEKIETVPLPPAEEFPTEDRGAVAVPIHDVPAYTSLLEDEHSGRTARRAHGSPGSVGLGGTETGPGSGPGLGSGGGTGDGSGGRGGGVGNGGGNTRYLREHFSYIVGVVQKHVSYPRVARQLGWEGRVVVSFVLLFDGSVRDVKVMQSSGRDVLDRNAVEAVRKAVPFPRPPAESQLIIPIVYRLR